jgi:hypothetical protein
VSRRKHEETQAVLRTVQKILDGAHVKVTMRVQFGGVIASLDLPVILGHLCGDEESSLRV